MKILSFLLITIMFSACSNLDAVFCSFCIKYEKCTDNSPIEKCIGICDHCALKKIYSNQYLQRAPKIIKVSDQIDQITFMPQDIHSDLFFMIPTYKGKRIFCDAEGNVLYINDKNSIHFFIESQHSSRCAQCLICKSKKNRCIDYNICKECLET